MFRDTEVSDCGKYLIVSIYEELRQNLLYIADIEANGQIVGKLPLMPIISEFNADYEVNTQTLIENWTKIIEISWRFQYVTNTGSKMIFRTNRNAPNFRLVVIDVNEPVEDNWSTLIAVSMKNSWFLVCTQIMSVYV